MQKIIHSFFITSIRLNIKKTGFIGKFITSTGTNIKTIRIYKENFRWEKCNPLDKTVKLKESRFKEYTFL